jgi:hypothetical protein
MVNATSPIGGSTVGSRKRLPLLGGVENLLKPMAQETWNVKLIDKGRTLQVQVQAHTQAEARRVAEHHYPGYKAMTAQRA